MSLYDEEFHELKTGSYASVGADGKLRYDAFCCSRCFKLFFVDRRDLYKMATAHAKKCSFRLGKEGIIAITKNNLQNAKLKHAIDSLGSISKHLQQIDFPMTDSDSVKKLNQVVFIYVDHGKPVGYLTTDNRNIILEEGTKKLFTSVSDFCVFPHVQRKGIGKKLFDAMLSYHEKTPAELAYCRPSYATQQFLRKWYDIDVQTVVCW